MTRRTERQARLAQQLRLAKETSLPEIAAETLRDILAAETAKPMRAGNADLSHNSLFGDSHKQIALF